MRSSFLLLPSLLATALALPHVAQNECPQTAPAVGDIVVDKSSKPVPGSHPNLQQAVDALSATTASPQSIFVYPGEYYGHVYIPQLKSPLSIQGYTSDCSSYHNNEVTITFNWSLINTTTDDLTATIRVWNSNTKIYNLNILNTFGHASASGQALAVSAFTGNQGYYGVRMEGYQDTLLSNSGSQLYANSLITGAVDFIFGQSATTWFEKVDIRVVNKGHITASGRDDTGNPSWYVFNNANVQGISETIPGPAKNSLGRPWGAYARVMWQNSYLSDVIRPVGWDVWSEKPGADPHTQHVTLQEFNNSGPGSVKSEGPRASFSSQAKNAIAIESILGANFRNQWWVDINYL
jgi:pectin methylesterase-like acyl-CoA thioesterase